MSLNEKVAAVFNGPRIDRIHFSLGRLEVSPARLRGVGKAIKDKRIGVTTAPTGKLLSAAYSPHSNSITLPDENVATVSRQAGIVHEGVHALVDLYRCKDVLVLNDEAAAYLTEAIFLRASHSWVSAGADAMAIYKAADEVARAHGLYEKRGVKLSLADVGALRSALHDHSAYSSIGAKARTTGHGVP